ncbi:MAG: hypothetical protein JWO02_3558 [Solirubrobacterales bacterium]|nr:hypothetical protein [Solirubrobacterales bacterium]
MVVRVLLLLIAFGAGGYAVVRHRDLDACADARQQVFTIGVQRTGPGAPPLAAAAAAVRRLRQACDTDAYVAGTQAMLVAGHRELALQLARAATDRQPRDVSAWGALALAADATGDRAAAATARRHVRQLNPLGTARG